ncbi:MAG: response regulator [Spirirestis rafaelensis WJT71-NPBG6]|jgi:DNA-binding response OmpR family regulator|nr:response regulator [Spirirestis rafaelensis WJT71-NPBG6]
MSEKPLILTVGSNCRNVELLNQFLNKEGYQTIGVSNLEELDRQLRELSEIKLVMLDIAGFDRTIWERCEQLQNQQIPFLVISPKQSATIQLQSLAHGARSMLVKPLVMQQLLALIKSLLGE